LTNCVTVVDYGVGNLYSVRGALEHCGIATELSSEPEKIIAADRLLLPGVGSFKGAMEDIVNKSLVEPISKFLESGRPILGICLGMQMLFSNSEEFGLTDGLDLIAGNVSNIPSSGENGIPHRIPHVGWNEIEPHEDRSWSNSVLSGIKPGTSFYFAHSFMGVPKTSSDKIAACDYDGIKITAAVQNENIIGCQFHPEKSGEAGLEILKNFITI
jgi:imidazole glycerol-phosphate synthase subunit HisH